MKDSGIEWIGEIPKEWKIVKVKKIFLLGRGRVISKLEISQEGEYPIYSSQTKDNGCLGYINTYDYDKPQLTWTTDGANAGTVFLREGKYNCTNVCGTLLPYNENNDLKYLCYILGYVSFYNKRADINGYKIMNNEMANIKIVIPNLNEQKRIASFLDKKCAEIDRIIEETKATIEEYKKLKQSIITEAVTKGIRKNRPMKDSGVEWIGEIPEDWDCTKITHIADDRHPYAIGDGDHGLIKTTDYVDEGIPFIRVQNLTWCSELNMKNVVYISNENNEKIKGSILKPGDILFAKTGATIGKTGIVPESLPISNTTSHIGKISVNIKYNEKYILYFLSSKLGYKQFWDIAIQKTTRPELAIDEIKQMKVIIPQRKEEQDEIVAYLEKHSKELDLIIDRKSNLLKELDMYKKSLIYEYVTGKKEVIGE